MKFLSAYFIAFLILPSLIFGSESNVQLALRYDACSYHLESFRYLLSMSAANELMKDTPSPTKVDSISDKLAKASTLQAFYMVAGSQLENLPDFDNASFDTQTTALGNQIAEEWKNSIRQPHKDLQFELLEKMDTCRKGMIEARGIYRQIHDKKKESTIQ
ncbi:MAG: hypothetical protein WAZ18_03250 [Alphaproteobacteria bacterium]